MGKVKLVLVVVVQKNSKRRFCLRLDSDFLSSLSLASASYVGMSSSSCILVVSSTHLSCHIDTGMT